LHSRTNTIEEKKEMNLKKALFVAIVGILAVPMIANAKPPIVHRIPGVAKKLHFAKIRLWRAQPHQRLWR
jgi:hypothetical protein